MQQGGNGLLEGFPTLPAVLLGNRVKLVNSLLRGPGAEGDVVTGAYVTGNDPTHEEG